MKNLLTDEQRIATQTYARVANTMTMKMFEIGNSADDRSVAVEESLKLMKILAMTPEISRRLPDGVEEAIDKLYDDVRGL